MLSGRQAPIHAQPADMGNSVYLFYYRNANRQPLVRSLFHSRIPQIYFRIYSFCMLYLTLLLSYTSCRYYDSDMPTNSGIWEEEQCLCTKFVSKDILMNAGQPGLTG